LHNGECQNIDMEGFFKDEKTGWYMKCDCNCRSCIKEPRNCVQCPFGFILAPGGKCTPQIAFTA